MPFAKFVCPHCEKPAEVQVTSVTRSRECPHCGQAVLLQVGGKNKKGQRKALLVGSAPTVEPPALKAPPKATKKARQKPSAPVTNAAPSAPEETGTRTEPLPPQVTSTVPLSAKGITGPAYEPKALEGEVFERMKMDPELQAHRRNLFTGIAVVGALIVLAVFTHFTANKDAPDAAPRPPSVAQPIKPPTAPVDVPKLPSNTIALRSPGQVLPSATTTVPQRLAFSPANTGDKAKPGTASGGNTTANEAMQSRPILGERKPAQQAVSMRPNLEPPPTNYATPTLSRTRPLMRPRLNGAVPDPLDLKAASRAVAAFLSAPSLDARLPLLANAPIVEAAMRSYYSTHVDGPIPFVDIMTSKESEFSTRQSEHNVLLKDGTTREVSVIHGDNDTYLVDWPSLVIHSEMDWSEFMATKPNQGKVFRVIAEFDNHFANYFADSSTLRCIKITNPLSPSAPIIYAYAEKQSIVGRELDHWIQSSKGKPIKLTLRLKYPTDADESNQVWITDLVSAGWVTPTRSASKGNVGLR